MHDFPSVLPFCDIITTVEIQYFEASHLEFQCLFSNGMNAYLVKWLQGCVMIISLFIIGLQVCILCPHFKREYIQAHSLIKEVYITHHSIHHFLMTTVFYAVSLWECQQLDNVAPFLMMYRFSKSVHRWLKYCKEKKTGTGWIFRVFMAFKPLDMQMSSRLGHARMMTSCILYFYNHSKIAEKCENV